MDCLAFQQLIEARVNPKRKDKAMSPERVILVRAAIETLRLKAIESCYKIQDCNDYLQMAWLYGDGPDWQPQRNDCVTYRFDGPDSNHCSDNYITLTAEGGCTLTINTAKKIKLQAPVIIPIHETSPRWLSSCGTTGPLHRNTSSRMRRTHCVLVVSASKCRALT